MEAREGFEFVDRTGAVKKLRRRVQLGFSAPQDVRIRRAELGSTIETRATIGNPAVVIDPPVAPA